MWVGSGVTQPLCSTVDLAACSWAGLHLTAVLMNVKIFLLCCVVILFPVFQTRSPLYIFIFQYTHSTLLVVLHLSLVPFCTGNILQLGTTDPSGSDCISWWQRFSDLGPVVPERLEENHIEKGLGVFLLVLNVYGVHRACRNGNGIGMGARVP